MPLTRLATLLSIACRVVSVLADAFTFECPAENNTIQWLYLSRQRDIYVVRCASALFSNMDLITDNPTLDRRGCAQLCTQTATCYSWAYLSTLPDPGFTDNSTCRLYTLNDYTPGTPNARYPLDFSPNNDSSTLYITAAIKVRYWVGYDQIYFPPPERVTSIRGTVRQTRTLLTAYPFTTITVLTRLATLTSAFTQTTTVSTALSDTTLLYPLLQVVPTLAVTQEVYTTTIVFYSTQQIVTVVPTVIVETAVRTLAGTLAVQNTVTNTQLAVTTVVPTVRYQQTVTAEA